MEVRGVRAKGRPRMKWMDNTRHDMNKSGSEDGDARDRRRWYSVPQTTEPRPGKIGGHGRGSQGNESKLVHQNKVRPIRQTDGER